MIIGDTYYYDLCGSRDLDRAGPEPRRPVEPDELRVWASTTGERVVHIEAGRIFRAWAEARHIQIANTQRSWDDLVQSIFI